MNKNRITRKKQKGGKDKLFPSVEKDLQDSLKDSLNKSIEKLFMTKQGNNYQLNLLDDDDYNDLVSLFKDGLKFRDKIVKPSPTYYYQDFSNFSNSPRYNIVELLFTQNIDFSDFLQYLDNHPDFDLFDKIENCRKMLSIASQYLNPTIEKLIEIFKEKEILNEVINPEGVTAYDRPILMLFSVDKNVIRLGGPKENRQPRIIELMELFISHGANIDRKDISGYNALMMASDRGYEQVVSYLLSINFDINSKHERRNLAYITPLYLAITNDHEDVVKILIEHKDPNNSISIEDLAKEAKDRDITLKMLELLEKEIKNRKMETLNDVVEQKTGRDGTDVTKNIFSFVKSFDSDRNATYGGTKKQTGGTKVELGIADKDRIKVMWKGKDRQIYTYPTDVYIPDSQEEEEEHITSLEQFNERDSFEQLEKALVPDITHLFVIIYDKNGAVMRLGDQEHSHSQLSGDKGNNYIIAAGEIRREEGEKKLKISNQSGHYEPDSEDVKDVTIDFFARRIDIDFYKPFPNISDSEPSQSQSPQSPLDMGYTKPDDGLYRVPKGGRKKSLKNKRKTKKRKTLKKKPRKTRRKSRK